MGAEDANVFRLTSGNVSLQAREIPGIKIFRSSATIYYANAEMYLEALQEKVCAVTNGIPKNDLYAFLSSLVFRISSLLLTMPGPFEQSGIDIGKLLREKKKRDSKLKRKLKKEKKQAEREAKRAKKEAEKEVRPIQKHPASRLRFKPTVSSLQTAESQTSTGMSEAKLFTGPDQEGGIALDARAKPANGLSGGRQNWAYQHDAAASDSDIGSAGGDDDLSGHPPHADEEKGRACRSGTHSVILDISTTNFADVVTVKTFTNVSGACFS